MAKLIFKKSHRSTENIGKIKGQETFRYITEIKSYI